MRKGIKAQSIKGHEKKIRLLRSKTEAEMTLFSFSFGIESRKWKEAVKKVEELIARNYPIMKINANSTNDSV